MRSAGALAKGQGGVGAALPGGGAQRAGGVPSAGLGSAFFWTTLFNGYQNGVSLKKCFLQFPRRPLRVLHVAMLRKEPKNPAAVAMLREPLGQPKLLTAFHPQSRESMARRF